MSLESEIARLTGIAIGTPLSAAEAPTYDQLRNRRVNITLEIIPPALRDEFTTSVFPDRNIKLYARALYKNQELHSKVLSDVVMAHMRASFNEGDFRKKLETRGVKAEDVLMKMMGT